LPTSQKADERYLKNLTSCLVPAYASSMKAAGFTMTRPDVRIYSGTVQTPCGQGRKGYPVFYCSANETIYSSAGSMAEYGETLRLGGYWIVLHGSPTTCSSGSRCFTPPIPETSLGYRSSPDRVAGGLPDGYDVHLGSQRQADGDRSSRDGQVAEAGI
jgi:hypothetical protein